MPSPRRVRWRVRDWVLASLAVLAFALALRFYFEQSGRKPPVDLNISAGDSSGLRHKMALVLAQDAWSRGIRLAVVPTAGSEEAIDRVDKGTLDAALVQGGLDMRLRRHVRQVAALHIEPVHLLVKAELYPDVARDLTALRGRRINIQSLGAGTHWMAMEILEFVGQAHNGTHEAGDYVFSTLSYAQLKAERDPSRLPDAVFLTSSLPSPIARHLVVKHGYRLVPLPFGEAFALGALDEDDEAAPSQEKDEVQARIRKEHVYDAVIPAYTYSVEPEVPPEPLHTLGTRLLLVANERVDPEVVGRLLDAVFETRFAKISHPPLDPNLLELPPEMPLHPGTVRYLELKKPLITGEAFDGLEKAVSIAGAVLGGSFFLWQWLRQRLRFRRDQGFESYILKVTEIERRAMELELSATLQLKPLLKLQQDLGRLKGEALDKFAAGELAGAELMSGFLGHVNDARNYLARLILHERENIEEQAQAEGRSARALWDEALGIAPAEKDATTAAGTG